MPTGHGLSKSRVDKAGERLREWLKAGDFHGAVPDDELTVLDQWRALHGPPMQATNMFIRGALRSLGIERCQVKQRHKRQPQILSKLGRQHVRLSQIEDIAGCRVIVPTLAEIRAVEEYVPQSRQSRTQLVSTDNYVATPRRGGYRAVHLHTVRDGMRVEIQLRTERQHYWAEAVEDWDQTFVSDLKHERGPEPALLYFKVLSEFFFQQDQGEQVPSELVEELNTAAGRVQRELGEVR
jgi:hypothetical protein